MAKLILRVWLPFIYNIYIHSWVFMITKSWIFMITKLKDWHSYKAFIKQYIICSALTECRLPSDAHNKIILEGHSLKYQPHRWYFNFCFLFAFLCKNLSFIKLRLWAIQIHVEVMSVTIFELGWPNFFSHYPKIWCPVKNRYYSNIKGVEE